MTQEDPTEKVIREYFEAYPGRRVEKLDLGKQRAADFRVCHDGNCFLCEVKTIKSVQANFPFTPLASYLEQREKRQKEIRDWKKENPDKRLILRSEDYEFIYGDEIEFTTKYQGRRRNTEEWFNKFAQELKKYLANSSIQNLPYSVRLDSDDLYRPTLPEQEKFFKWLEGEIQAVAEGKPGWHWIIERPNYGSVALYSVFYPIHEPAYENDTKAEYQLTIRGPLGIDSLEVNIHSYGTLNLDRITSNVVNGLEQLERSASRENDTQIPRIIVLAFESGIGWEWQQLSSHINWLLKENPILSAIAILDWTPDGTLPPIENGIEAWYQFYLTTPTAPRFVVYHNSWLQVTKPLLVNIFSDKWSVQLSPVKWDS